MTGAAPIVPASAQAIAVVVNGDPITTEDVTEQMVFLRTVHQPASRNDAIESLIADRLKLTKANRSGIDATDNDLSQTLARLAASVKMQPNVLAATLQKSKAGADVARNHLHAIAAWNNYVKAQNKQLSIRDEDVTAELAKDTRRAKEEANYTLQQIVFVIPAKSPGDFSEQRLREAQALRSRFTDCASGLPLARSLNDVAIKPPITRKAEGLSETARGTLEQTAKGHLTAPERVPEGIQMIAVCGKDDESDTTSLRDTVRADLLVERLSKEADRLYQDLRKTAVVERHAS